MDSSQRFYEASNDLSKHGINTGAVKLDIPAMMQRKDNEVNKSEKVDDKIIGCAAIILVGLCYKDEKNYLSYGLNLLKKISNLWVALKLNISRLSLISTIFFKKNGCNVINFFISN